MDWIGLIMKILALLTVEKVDDCALAELLGRRIEERDKRWRVEPNATYKDALSQAYLHVEKLESDEWAISTVELHLKAPWFVSPRTLEETLGRPARSMPARPARVMPSEPRSPSLRILAYDIQRSQIKGIVTVAGRPVDVDPASEIEITEIRIRRYYD